MVIGVKGDDLMVIGKTLHLKVRGG